MRRLGVMIALALALASAAEAEHEVYYRYVVLGFVTDTRGQPVKDRAVEVVRNKTGFSYLAETDEHGFFAAVLRLGDESVGETLTLSIGGLSTRITARFDPANHTDDRGTRLDLEGARFIERPAWFRPTLARLRGATPR